MGTGGSVGGLVELSGELSLIVTGHVLFLKYLGVNNVISLII